MAEGCKYRPRCTKLAGYHLQMTGERQCQQSPRLSGVVRQVRLDAIHQRRLIEPLTQ